MNVTLLFAVARYEQVIEAYLAGLERRLRAHEPLEQIASVASFFVSRVDAEVDALVPEDSDLRGRVAIANAQRAYELFRACFAGARWERLRTAGARLQRPLWASTGTKDPAYPDVLYVEGLITPDVINTMPLDTLHAFADHGRIEAVIEDRAGEATQTLRHAVTAGVDMQAITAKLERQGVSSFPQSYRELLGGIESRLAASSVARTAAGRSGKDRPRGGAKPSRADRVERTA